MRILPRLLLCACLLVALVAVEGAHAKRHQREPRSTAPKKIETRAPAVAVLPPGSEMKSPRSATKMSVWITLGSLPTVVMAVPGLIIGPSTGFFYGGMPGRGCLGIGLRTAAVAAMIIPIGATWNSTGDDTWAVMMFGGGAMLLVGSAIADMATVSDAVKRRNAKMMGPHLEVSPAIVGGTRSPGVRVGLKF